MKFLNRINRWAERRNVKIAIFAICHAGGWLKIYGYHQEAERLHAVAGELAIKWVLMGKNV